MNNGIQILEWPAAVAGSVILGAPRGISTATVIIVCLAAFSAGVIAAHLYMARVIIQEKAT